MKELVHCTNQQEDGVGTVLMQMFPCICMYATPNSCTYVQKRI